MYRPRFNSSHLAFHFGLPGAFLLVFFENLGIPLPTEVVYAIAQVLITKGTYNYVEISVVLLVGHVAGSLISYFLGRRIARGLQAGKETGAIQQKLEGWYEKYGVAAVFVARLVGQVRPWSSYVAGTAEMPFTPFLIATVIGTIVFNALALAVTAKIAHYANLHPWFRSLVVAAFVIGILVVVFIEVQHVLKRQKKKE